MVFGSFEEIGDELNLRKVTWSVIGQEKKQREKKLRVGEREREKEDEKRWQVQLSHETNDGRRTVIDCRWR